MKRALLAIVRERFLAAPGIKVSLMTFELEFDPRAWKEWKSWRYRSPAVQKKKLSEVIERPRIEAKPAEWDA